MDPGKFMGIYWKLTRSVPASTKFLKDKTLNIFFESL